MLKGMIFDLDGVLTDSATYHLQAWRELATRLRIMLPAEANEALRGRSRADSLALILRYGHQEMRYTEAEKVALAESKNAAYQRLIQSMTPADILPGVLTLLDAAKQAGLRLAIASASRNAPAILERLDLRRYFDGLVDPATLHRGKPDPEIFVKAAATIDLPNTVVMSFEDASAGVTAIKAAGQFAVGIGDPQVLVKADVIVPTTAALDYDQLAAAFASANL